MRYRNRWILLTIAGSLAAFGCSSDPAGSKGAGGSGGGEPAFCPDNGLTKGPWTFGIDATSAKMRWEACEPGTSGEVSYSEEEGGGGEASATATEEPFEVHNTYDAPLNPDAPLDKAGTYYMKQAALTGLKAGTCYRYALKADPTFTGRFCTARPSGSHLRFMAIGDTNPALGDATKNILSHTLPEDPDFIVHGGDIQYYNSFLETWAFWFEAMQPMLAQGGFFPALGNHESEKPDEMEQYTERFFASPGFDGTDKYYRFESAGVWFFALNSEDAGGMGLDTAQGKWFKASLAEASTRPGYRFSVLYFHRPFLTCGDTGYDPAMLTSYAPVLKQYDVPLVIQAHMHGYERFEIDGITYMTSGGGGGLISDVDENASRPECADRVSSGPVKHAVIFDVDPGKLTARVIAQDGTVFDSFEKAVP